MVVGKEEGVARFWVDTKFLPHLVTDVFQLNVVIDHRPTRRVTLRRSDSKVWISGEPQLLPHLVTEVVQLNVVIDRTTNPTGDPSKVRHSEDCILGQPQLLPHLLAQIIFVSALTAIICL